ncbi:hypothetical protein C9426_14255 [Serratia sp. S1B]|nr:hypothetical protein C9426_14255 [Serratia sp. S1B]
MERDAYIVVWIIAIIIAVAIIIHRTHQEMTAEHASATQPTASQQLEHSINGTPIVHTSPTTIPPHHSSGILNGPPCDQACNEAKLVMQQAERAANNNN